jgi:antitoxin component YwqK of YwqJK toxin-antitoxin module
MKKLFFFLLTVNILSCQTETLEKEVLYEYPTGKPKTEVTYKVKGDKRIKYLVETYYPNGNKESESYFDEEGKRHGIFKFWYENGNPWSETEFKHGIKDGINRAYYKEGGKRFEGQFKNDKRAGIWYFWDKKGNQVLQKNFDAEDDNQNTPDSKQ